MHEPLRLEIPKPCHENWAEMKPDEKGRFCLSCQKTVVDFSSMTDRQVLDYFSNYTGNTCGRFTDDQLNRDITVGVQKPTGWYKYMLSLFVPAFLLAGKSIAQGGVSLRKTDTISPARKLLGDTLICEKPIKASPQLENVLVGRVGGVVVMNVPMIKGRVVDDKGIPVPHATIMVKGTSYGTVSEPDGRFTISPEHGKKVVVQISHIGFETKEVKVTANSGQSTIVLMPLQTMLTGDVIIIGRKRKKQTVFHKFNRMIADSIGAKRSLVLYPNAAKPGSAVNISYRLDKGRYIIRVINTNGQTMQEDAVNIETKTANTSFRLNNVINAGQYVVVITDNKGKRVTSGQLIVQ